MVSVGLLIEALGMKTYKSLTPDQIKKIDFWIWPEIAHTLLTGEGILTKDNMLNIIRDGYDYSIKTFIYLKD